MMGKFSPEEIIEALHRARYPDDKITMAMLLDAEWVPPLGSNMPGYFMGKNGQYFTADGQPSNAPWLVGITKIG